MTDYLKIYKQFISSHQFYEGLRITIAVLLPVLTLAHFDMIKTGVTIALGAVCVSLPDNPGPIHHRRHAMLYTIGIIFFSSFLTGILVPHALLLVILLLVLSFSFSIIGAFSARAGAVGLAGLLVMVLSIDKSLAFNQALQNASLTVLGGFWYFVLSILLHQLRPYKLLQQVLGDCMQETANFLRIKANFYDPGVDYEKNYQVLSEAQVLVHQKQEIVRELLFKTRSIVRESTNTSRVLLMSFVDTIDLFERILTSQQEYKILHRYFDDTKLLQPFQHSLIQLSNDLQELGIAFQEGRASKPWKQSAKEMEDLEEIYNEARTTMLDENNVHVFISLRHILDSIKDLQSRIDTLHNYSTYSQKFPVLNASEREYKRFVVRSDYSPRLILENLNMDSNIFRHSIRVSIALLAGYLFSLFSNLPIGHNYWILLTIVVILKPAYSLTRERNLHRMVGTLIGAAIAAAVLFSITETYILIGILFFCMLIAYSQIRSNYFLSVIFMTAYIIIAFNFLKPGNLTTVLQDRVIDTAIGSAISYLLIFLLPPKWERENIIALCAAAIKSNAEYFEYISNAYVGDHFVTSQYKLRRKNIFVALANLGDAFQRMLNEPKSKQQKGESIHQLVVANHMIASHIATLSAYREEYASEYASIGFQAFIDKISNVLKQCENTLLNSLMKDEDVAKVALELGAVRKEVQKLVAVRQAELMAGNLETDNRIRVSEIKTLIDQFEIILRVAEDMKKVCKKIMG